MTGPFLVGFALGGLVGLVIAIALEHWRKRRARRREDFDILQFLQNPEPHASSISRGAPSDSTDFDVISIHPWGRASSSRTKKKRVIR